MRRSIIYFAIFLRLISVFGGVAAKEVTLNNAVITYNDLLQSHCELFLRHAIGPYPKGYGSGYNWCAKYAASKDSDIVNYLASKVGVQPMPVRKSDYISLDDFSVWNGKSPIRARFSIGLKDDDPDPDIFPSYLPYDKKNKVENYIDIDDNGYEINIKDGNKTGYRFYEFSGKCYLSTIKKPRIYKYVTDCHLVQGYDGYPSSIDTSGRPWINIMNQNTVDLNEAMPAELMVIRGANPVKPLIYSDFPIGDDGRVTKGRAMCMADCAPGMLMNLLHAGQSIWGPSGNPPPMSKSTAASRP